MELQGFDLYKIKGEKMLRKISMFFCLGLICLGVPMNAFSEEIDEIMVDEVLSERTADEISAEALDAYAVEGSLFEKITNLEQEKLIMKLEAERLKLGMELDDLNTKKMQKQIELDELASRGDQQQEIEAAKAELDSKIENLKKQIAEMDAQKAEDAKARDVEKEERKKEEKESQINNKFKLVNVIGVGNQLQATIQDMSSGQNKRISVGKQLNGYTVKSISLNDGIVFEKDGVSENLNVGK